MHCLSWVCSTFTLVYLGVCSGLGKYAVSILVSWEVGSYPWKTKTKRLVKFQTRLRSKYIRGTVEPWIHDFFLHPKKKPNQIHLQSHSQLLINSEYNSGRIRRKIDQKILGVIFFSYPSINQTLPFTVNQSSFSTLQQSMASSGTSKRDFADLSLATSDSCQGM